MRLLIIKGYTDSLLRRNVKAGEEITVKDLRAQRLIEKGVAVAAGLDYEALNAKVNELSEALEAKKAEKETEKEVVEENAEPEIKAKRQSKK